MTPDTPQELEQPPRVRWDLLIMFVGLSTLIALALIVVTAIGVFDDATSGPTLPRATRDEIASANCQQLSRLEARYAPNGDSVEPDATALQLTHDRQDTLHCLESE